MINPTIQSIIDNKTPCVFVSPHLDDAMLSAGGLIDYLSDKTKVIVVSVFTANSPAPYTYSAQHMLKIVDFRNFDEFYVARRAEDAQAVKSAGAEVVHLDFVDAITRKKQSAGTLAKWLGKFLPEFMHVYPIYRLNILGGKISKHDQGLMTDLAAKLKEVAATYPNAQVFGPAGVGNHVDHLIVSQVCKQSFGNMIEWLDYPYSQKEQVSKSPSFSWDDVNKKTDLMRIYKTQYASLFGNQPVTFPEEKYYEN
jgi:LmbE family N-acetylglucosaminyl deacetylase